MQTERVLQHSKMIKTIAVSRTEGCNRKLDHKLHSNERTRLPAGRGRLPQICRGNFDAFIVAVATQQCACVNRIATVQGTAGVLNEHAHLAERWSCWQNFAGLVFVSMRRSFEKYSFRENMKMGTQSMLIFQYIRSQYFDFVQLKLNSGVPSKQFLNLM